MKPNSQPRKQKRQVLIASMTAALSLTAAIPLWAVTPAPSKATVPIAAAKQPAQKCLTDLSAFQARLQKEGYWRGGSSYGYGYPMNGYNYDEIKPAPTDAGTPAVAYWRARPGYEIRTLLASAQILAQRGQQQPCEALLATTRDIYSRYAADMRDSNVPRYDVASYRQTQLAAAEPVAGQNVSYRSDQLIGTEVLTPKGEELGSVDDLVFSPRTGKITYLVIGRGGLFGINEKYVPVPWASFRATTGAKLLVLDTTKADMAAAPQVKQDHFSATNDFDKQSKQVDAYWSAHPAK